MPVKANKTRRRRGRKRAEPSLAAQAEARALEEATAQEKLGDGSADDVHVKYVTADVLSEADIADESRAEFAEIFGKFSKAEELMGDRKEVEDSTGLSQEKGTDKAAKEAHTARQESARGPNAEAPDGSVPAADKGTDSADDDSGSDSDEDMKDGGLSKRMRKKLYRLSVAELKQLVERPDVVEEWDPASADPRLLVFLKSYRNTVSVPRHWNQKRAYLQGKRGQEKPPFELPSFIEDTGIRKQRELYWEQEDNKSMAAKARSRVRPKMGKNDIDYQILHDAFFRHQTKPKMTMHGEIYFEGKEFERDFSKLRPGDVSDELRVALEMKEDAPPPWLINMQRYGPPPSYPHLRIPGLNAPIPPGASWGYHPGGWGRPPVDSNGAPLYGDVFGAAAEEGDGDDGAFTVERDPWGELESDEESEGDAEEDDDGDEDHGEAGGVGSGEAEGMPGTTSIPGTETPDTIQLRKDAGTVSEEPRSLFQVLPEKQANVGSSLMGSSHKYVVPQSTDGKSDVNIALNPNELEELDNIRQIDTATLREKYREQLEKQKAGKSSERAEVQDVYLEETLKKKRKLATQQDSKKKYKDFKF